MKIPVRKNSSNVVSGGGMCLPSRQRINLQSRGASLKRTFCAASHSSSGLAVDRRAECSRAWQPGSQFCVCVVVT